MSGVPVVILAGGRGTRLAEETEIRPKPMVEIGGFPILWHIMRIYGAAGFDEFVIACGYRGSLIKEYFHTYATRHSDFRVDLSTGGVEQLNSSAPGWTVSVIDTGLETMTGGRLLRLRGLLEGGTFMVTYGDGVADVDVAGLLRFHRSHGRVATITAVRPPSRFGALELDGDRVCDFSEKPQTEAGWINGGFLVFEPRIFDYLDGDDSVLEGVPLERVAADGQLMAHRHTGFWQAMDTLRDKQRLEALWASDRPPWRIW